MDKLRVHRKSLEARLEEAMNIYKGVRDAGVPETHPGFVEFRALAGAFVRTGLAQEGRIPLRGFGRALVYDLTPNVRRASSVTLRVSESLSEPGPQNVPA
jgi:hypothetical protein